MFYFTPKHKIETRHGYAETIIPLGDFTNGYWNQLIDYMINYGWTMRDMFSFVDTKTVLITFSFIDQYENI